MGNFMADGELAGRVAIVTGGGRGIGYAIAARLCAAGATVVIGELDEGRGIDAATRLRSHGYAAEAHELNVVVPTSCANLCTRVLQDHGRIDVLVNNAGVFVLGSAESMPEAVWRMQIDVLLNGAFFMAQAVAREAMIPQRRGAIVNIASIGGLGGWPLRSAYNAAKAGLIVLNEVLATEWAQYTIRSNCISPGVTRTELNEEAIRKGMASDDKYAHRTPLGRTASVDEIAGVALFLASDRASAITGENVRVDGGWAAWANGAAIGFPEPHHAH
jgi:NAD(P)-dependent dehydrogenase (short-subunit alcohol dehydrogenase family)